jgi:hypothetical protein
VLVTVFCLAVTGCRSGDKIEVSGTVKLNDGSPLVNARVTAMSTETAAWASGTTDQQGRFTLGTEIAGEGLAPGKYRLSVVEDQGDWDHPQPPKISRKFGNPETSGLTLKIENNSLPPLDLVLDPA